MYKIVSICYKAAFLGKQGQLDPGVKMADTLGTTAANAAEPGLGVGDLIFLALLLLALLAVALSGRVAYQQGLRLEIAKANAQAFVHWAEEAVADAEHQAGLHQGQCARKQAVEGQEAVTPASTVSWTVCRQVLLSEKGPLSELSNPFDKLNPVTGSKCERKQQALRGVVFFEKGTAAPPGMPPAVAWSPLSEDEALVRGLMLRVSVCDGGGYPVRIAEVNL